MQKANYIEERKAIADRIKELRIKSGYTSYEAFAVENGLPRKNYWRMETGENFTINTLIRILKIQSSTIDGIRMRGKSKICAQSVSSS